ncbi:hypothetical protein BN2364_1651 [Alloalcanivorax xenomutans]|nr:hypothetical protein BN2364_1651 [Alloalcanivorax xenomutans]
MPCVSPLGPLNHKSVTSRYRYTNRHRYAPFPYWNRCSRAGWMSLFTRAGPINTRSRVPTSTDSTADTLP